MNARQILDDWRDGNIRVLDYACGPGLASQALAPHVKTIVGVDEDQAMIRVYNEIAKRQGYPLNSMQAFGGDLTPDSQTGKTVGIIVDKTNKMKIFKEFDLVVVAVRMPFILVVFLQKAGSDRTLVRSG